MADLGSTANKWAAVLAVAVAVAVAAVRWGRPGRRSEPESTARQSTVAPSAHEAPRTGVANESAPPSGTERSTDGPSGPVFIRIDRVKFAGPEGAHVQVHLRANINGFYYDYPGDAGAAPFAIPRSYFYEMYFELRTKEGTMSGASETLKLTSPSGTMSDKLPFSEEYALYETGHGRRAAEPSAVISFSITETP